MSAPQMTTAEALRAALASTIACSAQELQEAVGHIVVATSAECPNSGSDVRSLSDPQTRTTVLLADRIPAGQEAAAVAREIERHHGRRVAQVVLGDRGAELLGREGEVSKFKDPNEFLLSEYSKYAEHVAEGDPMVFDDWLAGSDVPEIVKARELSKLQERKVSNYTDEAALRQILANGGCAFAGSHGAVAMVPLDGEYLVAHGDSLSRVVASLDAYRVAPVSDERLAPHLTEADALDAFHEWVEELSAPADPQTDSYPTPGM